MGTILVTGGAGYIGSHVARQLGERGEELLGELAVEVADPLAQEGK